MLPFGIRLISRGTMSHGTTVPHLPWLASSGNAETLTGEEVTLAVPAVNSMVWSPVPLMPRSANRAMPFASVVAVVFPSSVPPPEMLAVTAWPEIGVPPAAVTTTTG